MGSFIKLNKLHMASVSLSSISFEVKKGEIIGITGDNGCGKTTLAEYLLGIRIPEGIGQIMISGCDTFSLLDRERLYRVATGTKQNPDMVFENVKRDFVFRSENLGVDAAKNIKRMKHYMRMFDVADVKFKTSDARDEMGPELQRLAMARQLAAHSELVVFDEIFSMQSQEETRKYLDIIITQARKRSLTLIFMTKNPYVLKQMDRCFVMKGGLVSEELPEKINVTEPDMGQQITERSYRDTEDARALVTMKKVFPTEYEFKAGHLYRLRDITPKQRLAFNRFMAGKSIKGVTCAEGVRTAYTHSFPDNSFIDYTVLDDVMFGPYGMGMSKKTSRNMAKEILRFVKVDEQLWSRSPYELSFGEQRLVSIASAIVLNPDILVMNRPFACLDSDNRKRIEEIVTLLCREGKCVIIAE